MEHLGQPQNGFKSIHIAGTNGKGSSAHMLASILQEAGYKTALYTSPHLIDFRERIKINGEQISETAVLEFFEQHRPFFEANQLSFFEMTVGLAFDYFCKQEVDIAVVEVGLGGRLDSTNVLTPLVSAITNIGLDHTNILGTTLEAIADEKAGIIKTGVPVVVGEEDPILIQQFREIAKQHQAPFVLPNRTQDTYAMDLLGAYQQKNQQLVRAVVERLSGQGLEISDSAVRRGLGAVVPNTALLGRWQALAASPSVICDTAHNPHGLKVVLAQLLKENFDHLHMVIGMVSDKDVNGLLTLLPKNAAYYFVSPSIKRAIPANTLREKAMAHHLSGMAFNNVEQGYRQARAKASKNDLIFIGGSTFVVAEVLKAELN